MAARKRSKLGKARQAKVLRIFHWEERYAVDRRVWPDDRGLLFVRMFVAPVDTESTHYFGQLRDLRSLVGDRYHRYRDVFHDAMSLAASLGKPHQGYLVDEQLQPLKDAQIAVRLELSLEETRTVLKALRQVNLIERVDLPDWADLKRQQRKTDQDKSGQEESRDAQGRARESHGAQGRARESNGAQHPVREVLSPATGGGENSPGTIKNADSGQLSPAPGGCPGGPESANLFRSENGLNRNGNPNAQAKDGNGSAEGQNPKQAEAIIAGEARARPVVPSPPTTQPSKPNEAEGGSVVPSRHVGTNAPPRSDSDMVGSLGQAATQRLRRFNAEATQFGEWIWVKLGFGEPGDDQAMRELWRREVSAYASVWEFACGKLSASQLLPWREWAIAEAAKLHANSAACKSTVPKWWMSNAKFKVRTLAKKVRH